jgi:hypothetical protein
VVKNILLGVVAAAVLTACAAPAQKGVQPEDIRDSAHFVTESIISNLDFPSLQSRLFQHRSACGSAPRFIMDKGETGYAMLVETAEVPESYENVIIADLVQYPESFRAPMRVAFRVYSYYYNDDVQQRLDRMMAAVRTPGVCTP